MKREELANEAMTTMMAVMNSVKNEIWTAMPAIVRSVNLELRTCNVQPAIQARRMRPAEDEEEWIDLPELLDCPIVYPQGGGYSITFPIAEGDEVLIILASRCIDGWWELGGVQPQLDMRMHSLSDGFCIPGVSSKVRASAVNPAAMVIGGGAGEDELGGILPASSITIGAEGVTVASPTVINLNAPLVLVNGTPIP